MRVRTLLALTATLACTGTCVLVERSPYGRVCTDDPGCGEGYRCLEGYCQPTRFIDAGSLDAGVGDGTRVEAGPNEAGEPDGPRLDSASTDRVGTDRSNPVDAAALDVSGADRSALDAGPRDVIVPDLGQPLVEAQVLANPSPAQGDTFGSALALLGDTLVVGRSRASNPTPGDALVYRLASGTTWHLEQSLSPPGLPMGDSSFGSSVALGGDWLAVGDPTSSSQPGAVHLFERVSGTWLHRGPIARTPSSNGDAFGQTVALSVDGAHLAVGGPGAPVDFADGGGALYAGAVWLFARSGGSWTQIAHRRTPGPNDGSGFGSALALSASGDTCVVGAPGEDVPGAVRGGALYVFGRSGTIWADPIRVTGSPSYAGDLFGTALALVDGLLAVGIPGADDDDLGRVELYADPGLSPLHVGTLVLPARTDKDRFGSTLAASSITLAVGAVAERAGAAVPAQVYERSGGDFWPLGALLPAAAQTSEGFGEALALSDDGRWLAVGLPRREVGGVSEVGQVVLYRR